MDSTTSLIVPVQVDTLLVNKRVRANEPFRRWYPDFERLDQREAPEPDPFGSASSDKPGLGAHVHWQLPDALRRGEQDGPAGRVEFRYVPNRWLVVRYSRPATAPGATPTAAGWVVDSDFLDDDEGTSAFLDPAAPGLVPAWIGRAVPVTTEPFDGRVSDTPFLTAVGPGLPTFSAFQPYNENVFSLHDPLTGLTEPSLIGYAVVGWYSDPEWDILHAPPGGDVRAWLDTLRWATTDPALTPTRSYCAGTSLGLRWDPDGDRPTPDRKPDDINAIDIAVGHVAPDAATALTPAALDDPEAALLWEAFGYDLLDVLDEDGESALDQALRRTWFGAEEGGHRWRVVDRPRPPGGERRQRAAREITAEREWLDGLNRAQSDHDTALRELAHLQRRLYGLWWLRGRRTRPPGWDTLCDARLDPAAADSLATDVRTATEALFGADGLRSKVPWGDTAGELAGRIAEFAEGHIAPDRELQRCPEPSFHSTPDPSIVVRGARLDRPLTDEDALPCRTAAETVTGVVIDGAMAPAPAEPPAPRLGGVPGQDVIAALLKEFFLLDRAALSGDDLEQAIADPGTRVRGSVARWTRPWEQPWSPLHLVWKTDCHPTPYHSAGTDHWSFDGTRYTWDGTGAVDPATLTGRALLNPLLPFNTRSRLTQHIRTHPRGPVAELAALRERTAEDDELSQRIDGVNLWLAQHSPAFNLRTDLVDTSSSRVPLSEVPDPGPVSEPPREFRPVRAGQLAFEQLHVIDRFGRSLAVISPDNHLQYAVKRADSVVPDIPVNEENAYRYIQLPPRLLQPARLRFDFVSAADDHRRIVADDGPEAADGDTPVCGWLIVNRLADSLLVHAPDGTALGEIRAVLDTAHRRAADWDPLPGSPYPEAGDGTGPGREFRQDLPHLHGFVTGLLDGGPDAFDALLATVDSALSATAPQGEDTSLAALVGRPMALLRGRVRLELDGPAMTASSWEEVLAPSAPEFTEYRWNVRLGAGDIVSDGLAGFFTGTDYTTLHTVAERPSAGPAGPPDPDRDGDGERAGGGPGAPGYTVPIDGREIALRARPARGDHSPEGSREDEDTAWLTLLADPWAAVHAVSDILPVARLELPETWVRTPLGRVRLAFRTGPLLAGVRKVPGAEGAEGAEGAGGARGEEGAEAVDHLVMPHPSGRRGTWSWAEPAPGSGGAGDWTTLPLAPPDPALALSDTTPAARSGYLRLSGALDESGSGEQPPGSSA
ncbi:hypothetical protein [Streptomyces sp. NPDC001985]|uniref:hypothetical protein n=1 Tax=Streptomyces sp. NPDC001985 TaxID=3154406 RepID=UPI0033308B8D